jgi:hypothetical protein
MRWPGAKAPATPRARDAIAAIDLVAVWARPDQQFGGAPTASRPAIPAARGAAPKGTTVCSQYGLNSSRGSVIWHSPSVEVGRGSTWARVTRFFCARRFLLEAEASIERIDRGVGARMPIGAALARLPTRGFSPRMLNDERARSRAHAAPGDWTAEASPCRSMRMRGVSRFEPESRYVRK